ncbi:MAG: hypothetical protein IJO32_02440 [Bacilli bacterium]|nr:hypothetical protein [Bacilli bacterium]
MKTIKSKERKKLLIRGSILLVVGIISLILVLYNNFSNKDKDPFKDSNTVTDAVKFKNEYEELNDKSLKLEIPKNNPMKYIDYMELMEILEDGTGIIYFGFPACPWCRNAVPVLLDAAKEKDINEIYYFNALEMRDIKELDENGNIITKKEGTEQYKNIVNKLYDYLDVYEGLNDDSIKRLYFPNIFFIQNGKVVKNNMATVESQTDPKIPLNDEQYQELKNIYLDGINKIYNYSCNEGC